MRSYRPKSYAALWAFRLASFALSLVVVSFFLHFFALINELDFSALLAAGIFFALCAILLSGFGLWALWRCGAQGGRKSVKALSLALLILAPVFYQFYQYYFFPRFYDITTNHDDPPAILDAAIADPLLASARLPINKESLIPQELQRERWPNLNSRFYPLKAKQLRPFIIKNLEDKAWPLLKEEEITQDGQAIMQEDKKDNKQQEAKANKKNKTIIKQQIAEMRFYSLARSFPFYMQSDIVIRVRNMTGGALVDMRAASRYVKWSAPQNLHFIREFMQALDKDIYLQQNLGLVYIKR